MEKIIPKDCPYAEIDPKDSTFIFCSVAEDYINTIFAACTTRNYSECEYYKVEGRKEKIIE